MFASAGLLALVPAANAGNAPSGGAADPYSYEAIAERWRELTQRIGVDKQREAYRHLVRFEDNE